jgi:hypothetical protein
MKEVARFSEISIKANGGTSQKAVVFVVAVVKISILTLLILSLLLTRREVNA